MGLLVDALKKKKRMSHTLLLFYASTGKPHYLLAGTGRGLGWGLGGDWAGLGGDCLGICPVRTLNVAEAPNSNIKLGPAPV